MHSTLSMSYITPGKKLGGCRRVFEKWFELLDHHTCVRFSRNNLHLFETNRSVNTLLEGEDEFQWYSSRLLSEKRFL